MINTFISADYADWRRLIFWEKALKMGPNGQLKGLLKKMDTEQNQMTVGGGFGSSCVLYSEGIQRPKMYE